MAKKSGGGFWNSWFGKLLTSPISLYGGVKKVASSISSALFGDKPTVEKLEKLTGKQFKTQEQLQDVILDQLIQWQQQKDVPVPEVPSMEQVMPGGVPQIQQPQFEDIPEFNQQAVDAATQAAEQQFFGRDVPKLTERFAAGGNRSTTTPQFASALGRAAGDMRTNLAAQLQEMRNKYGLERAGLQTKQGLIGLQGQQAAADTAFRGGEMNINNYLNQLKRADVASTIQARRYSPLAQLTPTSLQSPYDYVARSGTRGSIGDIAMAAAKLAPLLLV